jgi:YidC/Oxa1 family membrane protein insertase
MNMDKNTVIGVVLLALLFFGFFYFTNKEQQADMAAQKIQADSIARVNAAKIKPADIAKFQQDSMKEDSAQKVQLAGDFQTAATASEQLTVVENDLMKITFTNKGGMVKSLILKGFRSWDSSLVTLTGGKQDALGYTINTKDNQSARTSDLYFSPSATVKAADGSQTISYTLASANGESITHQFIIRPNDYMIDWNVLLKGADKLLTQNTLNIQWSEMQNQQQFSSDYEKQQSRLCFYDNNEYDYNRAYNNGTSQDYKDGTQWVSFKQQFFNTTLIAKDKFKSGHASMMPASDSLHQLFTSAASLQVAVPAASAANVSFQLYFGPNDYKLLSKYNNGMENIIDLGSGIFSFVKYINRWIIMPVFAFFAGFVVNYGWVIALLTLFIRLVTSPLTYSSYVSGAKMKVMRPELDELKKKFGDDKQGYAMEQMKVFKEAGINPIGGCLPALLQIPIFFSLYSFFSSNILLRGKSFLWSKDLSAYDPFFKFHVNIPLLGDHLSLFTITACLTSFFISLYSRNNMPTDQSNPAMKYMPFIFPFVLIFVFNRLPAALTWYYTVSNIVTLGIQFVIQQYIIDHEKILAQIDLKRKSPKTKTKSKFQERYEAMLESQKKVQDLKSKNQGKK